MAFTILNFNAYRAADEKRFKHFRDLITLHKPMICTIQEIHIGKAVRYFGKDFNVLVNIEQSSRDQIGICTMVHRSLGVEDFIIGDNGRIIGVRIGSIKLFNLYPKSGTQNRMAREQFFNEDLPNLIKVWGGSKKESLQGLSMKGRSTTSQVSKEDKIRAIEAKLKALEKGEVKLASLLCIFI